MHEDRTSEDVPKKLGQVLYYKHDNRQTFQAPTTIMASKKGRSISYSRKDNNEEWINAAFLLAI